MVGEAENLLMDGCLITVDLASMQDTVRAFVSLVVVAAGTGARTSL